MLSNSTRTILDLRRRIDDAHRRMHLARAERNRAEDQLAEIRGKVDGYLAGLLAEANAADRGTVTARYFRATEALR